MATVDAAPKGFDADAVRQDFSAFCPPGPLVRVLSEAQKRWTAMLETGYSADAALEYAYHRAELDALQITARFMYLRLTEFPLIQTLECLAEKTANYLYTMRPVFDDCFRRTSPMLAVTPADRPFSPMVRRTFTVAHRLPWRRHTRVLYPGIGQIPQVPAGTP